MGSAQTFNNKFISLSNTTCNLCCNPNQLNSHRNCLYSDKNLSNKSNQHFTYIYNNSSNAQKIYKYQPIANDLPSEQKYISDDISNNIKSDFNKYVSDNTKSRNVVLENTSSNKHTFRSIPYNKNKTNINNQERVSSNIYNKVDEKLNHSNDKINISIMNDFSNIDNSANNGSLSYTYSVTQDINEPQIYTPQGAKTNISNTDIYSNDKKNELNNKKSTKNIILENIIQKKKENSNKSNISNNNNNSNNIKKEKTNKKEVNTDINYRNKNHHYILDESNESEILNTQKSDIIFESITMGEKSNISNSSQIDYYLLSKNIFNIINKLRTNSNALKKVLEDNKKIYISKINISDKNDTIIWNEKIYLSCSSYFIESENNKSNKKIYKRVKERINYEFIYDEYFINGLFAQQSIIDRFIKVNYSGFYKLIHSDYTSGAVCCFPSKTMKMKTVFFYINLKND